MRRCSPWCWESKSQDSGACLWEMLGEGEEDMWKQEDEEEEGVRPLICET